MRRRPFCRRITQGAEIRPCEAVPANPGASTRPFFTHGWSRFSNGLPAEGNPMEKKTRTSPAGSRFLDMTLP